MSEHKRININDIREGTSISNGKRWRTITRVVKQYAGPTDVYYTDEKGMEHSCYALTFVAWANRKYGKTKGETTQ